MKEFDGLKGSRVLITGGTKGVGKGIADCFLEHGSKVLVCGRHRPETLARKGGQEAQFLSCDIRDFSECERLIRATVEAFGGLDVLINNAGGSPFAAANKASPRFSEAIIRLNLLAPLNLAQLANAVMQEQETGGTIINISRVSGTRPSPGTAAYGAAKAGLNNLTETLGVEWAPKVRVNSIIAGLIQTEQSHLHYGDQKGIERVAQTIPMGRMGLPQDIGQACLFLASPLASYMSGSNLTLHGAGERPAFLTATEKES